MHRNSAGFLTLPLAGYAAIAAILAIAAMGVAIKLQASRYERLQQEYSAFRGGVEALGLAAKKAAAEKEAQDKLRKEQADELHRKAVDDLNADIRRLRARRADRSILPAAPTASSRPSIACFDRPELGAALSRLDGDLQAIVGEGAAATVDLNSAKIWAQRRD